MEKSNITSFKPKGIKEIQKREGTSGFEEKKNR